MLSSQSASRWLLKWRNYCWGSVRMSGIIWNTLVFLCIYDGSNRSCHELICISFLLFMSHVLSHVMSYVLSHVMSHLLSHVMSHVLSHEKSHEKSHIISQSKSHVKSHSCKSHSWLIVILYCSLVRRISGHVLCLYKVLSFAALSLFPFLSSLDLLTSTIRDNYNKYYVHQLILSILSFSKKPHRKFTG